MDGQPRLDGHKADRTKPRLGLVSKVFIWAIAKILTDAATKLDPVTGKPKYGLHNWRNGLEWSCPYDALQRHLTAWWDGEDIDPDSGMSHLWHASCELMFLVEYEVKGVGKDDRYRNVEKQSVARVQS